MSEENVKQEIELKPKKPRKPRIEAVTVRPKEHSESRALVNPENLIATAIKNGASIDMLERLIDLQDKLQNKEAEKAFREAMSKFQSECPVIPKKKKVYNKDGKTVRYKYAPLDDIIEIIKPYLGKHGLSFDVKTPIIAEGKGLTAKVRIFHILGHFEESEFSVPIDTEAYMNEPQKFASARTFSMRYALKDALGIVTGDSDDDGNILGDPKENQKFQAEKDARLDALPQNIKDGFKALGYGRKAAFAICEEQEWDSDRIKKRQNYIADNLNKKRAGNR